MDSEKNSATYDLKDPSNKIGINNYSTMTHGVFGNGLCIKNTQMESEVLLEDLTTCDTNECFFSFWVKHKCKRFSKNVLLEVFFFTISCNGDFLHEGKSMITVSHQTCHYTLPAKYDLWYHLSLAWKSKEITMHIDGEKKRLISDCYGNVQRNVTKNFAVGSTTDTICLDELLLHSKYIPADNIFQMYTTFKSGIYIIFNIIIILFL